jgi:hypothetical protein
MTDSEHKKYRREIARKNRNDHYDKVFARSVTKLLPKKPCEICLLEGVINNQVEAHHDNYKQPYKVRWLCKRHHEQVDTEKDRKKKENK